jgi:hypothetical protein
MIKNQVSRAQFTKKLALNELKKPKDERRYSIWFYKIPKHIYFQDSNKDESRCDVSEVAYYSEKDVFAFSCVGLGSKVSLERCDKCNVSNDCVSKFVAEQFPEDVKNGFIDFYIQDSECFEIENKEYLEEYLSK